MGLNDHLRLALAPFDIFDFSTLVERAKRIENEMSNIASRTQVGGSHQQLASKKRQFEGGDSSRSKHSTFDHKQKQIQYQEKPNCRNCGKRHLGQCFVGSKNCFKCGRPGHIRANCPSVGRDGGSQGSHSQSQSTQQSSKRVWEGNTSSRNRSVGRPPVPYRAQASGSRNEPVVLAHRQACRAGEPVEGAGLCT